MALRWNQRARRAPAAGRTPAAAAPPQPAESTSSFSFDALFVSWNIARAAEEKATALDRLLLTVDRALFVGLQETGDADFSVGALGAVLDKHGYVPFSSFRNNDSSNTNGGVALLVRKDVVAVRCAWPEADDWPECEVASVRVTMSGDRGEFTVSTMYVHGASTDTAGFDRVIRTMRPDQLVMGDLNAQMPGSRGGDIIAHYFKQRGESLASFIESAGCMYPTPTGPTRRTRAMDEAGRTVLSEHGTVNDHIIVGSELFSRATFADDESVVLPDDPTLPSDHAPLVWSASLGVVNANTMSWCARVAWHLVTEQHKAHFNVVFVKLLRQNRLEHRLDMLVVESALATAARKALPHTRPRDLKDGLFWTKAAQQRVAATIELHGNGAQAEISKSYAAARRQTLAENASITPDPTSCWNFVKRFLAFKKDLSLCPPLHTVDDQGQPLPPITDPTERADALGAVYAKVSGNPDGMDAQADLDVVIDRLAKDASSTSPQKRRAAQWHPVSITELRAAVSSFTAGKSADSFRLKAEHLKLLTDLSLGETLPFINRCLSRGAMPPHWLQASVTPVPKRNRDLTLTKSWRPVSVTSLLCRLCETVMHNRVSHAIERLGNRLGKSQFGFRRGVGTSVPLAGLTMFIRDGFRQQQLFKPWDAFDAAQRDEVRHGEQTGDVQGRKHVTLLVSIDASDAFCRALPAKAVQKLIDIGCTSEARWIAQFLKSRGLSVKGGSKQFDLERGVPQGSILGPVLWSLVIEDLIVKCEEKCRTPLPGCVVVPIVFADDINFAIRGFNPSSMIAQANIMMDLVREWATAGGIPMAKLQATWITGGTHAPWATEWEETHKDNPAAMVRYTDELRCFPSTAPHRLLGVIYDTRLAFKDHVDHLVTQCEKHLKLLAACSSVVSAEKLAILYRGIILSRMLFACESWYSALFQCDRDRLQSIHYRACCLITGINHSYRADQASVCYEAGFRMLNEMMRDETVKSADRLRRLGDGCRTRVRPEFCFGVEWVVRLFKDGVMPTAALRPIRKKDGSLSTRTAQWPPADFKRSVSDDSTADSSFSDSLRDIGIRLRVGAPKEGADPRLLGAKSLRPLARPHPFPPHELAVFDTHVRFVVDPPGGLVKPDEPIEKWPEEVLAQFHLANVQRMQELHDANGDDCVYIFTDGSRNDDNRRCAGAFVVCIGQDPSRPRAVKHNGVVEIAPIACVYTAELRTIHDALEWVLAHSAQLFRGGRPRRVVLVTDSKSSLESMKTSWVRRIDFMEQESCRLLFDLARKDIHVTLSFVFSHVGGCPGNEYIDQRADTACEVRGHRWTDPLWCTDTTRHILNEHHRGVDQLLCTFARARNRDDGSTSAFRFRVVPERFEAPSKHLPRGMSRWHEKLVFRARVGLLPAVGGMIHGSADDCPFCAADGALGRGGATIEHLAQCASTRTGGLVTLDIAGLWLDPAAAALSLSTIAQLAAALPVPASSRT